MIKSWLVLIGKLLLICLCLVIFLSTLHSLYIQREKEETRRWNYVYSTDRSSCNEYTYLIDFEFHSGLRNFATITFANGDKFLYECGERAIDICNNLRVGTRVCYYKDEFTGHPMEVVQGWNKNLE
jgi:hypothetical protein